MFKDIKFNKLKDGLIGNLLAELKYIGKEAGFEALCFITTPKGGNVNQTRRQLLGLKNKGYFDISIKNNKTFFRLTPKGNNLTEMVKFCLGKLKWDGLWRILIFDIPERQRHKRDSLRNTLLSLGLKQLQESVWITPFPLPDEFNDFLTDLRVRPYLYSITGSEINREDELKKHFNID
jgi:phenylacetic acid degradation operon negative regulatory protein